MTAAPCHHSKDQPAPTHRGRDRLRRRRQRPSQVRSKTSRARPCEASGALLLSNGGTGGGHAACTLWPPKVGFRLAKAKSLCDLRIRLWRIRSLWRPLGTFPRGESTSSARRRTKPPHKKYIPCGRQGKEPFLLSPYPKGFRLCGGDQRAFRSPFGNLRPLAASRNLCKKQLPCRGQENAFLSRITNTFASAEATRGLPPSPPEPLSLAKNIPSTAWRIRNKTPGPRGQRPPKPGVPFFPKILPFPVNPSPR